MKKIITFIIALIMVVGLSSCGSGNTPLESSESEYNGTDYESITYTINGEEKSVKSYYDTEDAFILDMTEQHGEDTVFFIYGTDEITQEILESRTESEAIIIERTVGMATNENVTGEGWCGIVLNTENSTNNYISYSGVDFDIHDGTIILTYFIYNPGTNVIDDIMERYDFVLDREYEN